MPQQTIKTHEFANKNKVELVVDQGNYGTIGELSSFAVYFLEYYDGPYYDGGKEDHHYMVAFTLHFPLTAFTDAVKCFQLYVLYHNTENREQAAEIWNEIKRLPAMRLEEIKSFHDTLFQKDKSNTLPGAQIEFQSICSTGSSENSYGVGRTDISLHRPGSTYPWVDLIDILYSDPTQDQLLDAQTTPGLQPHHSNIQRRVSRKQANAIQRVIMNALDKEFKGVIPADDEL